MASTPVPIYTERGRTYHPDTCAPLAAAAGRGVLRLAALGRGAYPGRRIPAGVLPGLRSVGLWDADRPQDWGLPWHRNEGIELTLLDAGRMPFALEHRRWTLAPGDLTITRPWQPHRVGDPTVGVGRLLWLILDVGVRQPHQAWRWPRWVVLAPADLRELTGFLRGDERPVWKAGPELRGCFREVGRVLEEGAADASRLAVYVNELLLHLLRLFRARRVPLQASLTSARRSTGLFLRSLPGSLDERWTLESMAAACGLGTTRFAHYCRELTNRTPLQHLNRLRVERAAAMLRAEPRRSVTDVAFACGFSSSQYFATVFRRHLGGSPRAVRGSRGEGEPADHAE
jgi:AraC family L-rhamnose operon regulatory protein RhaS